jgi:ribosomal protein S18 acetylase RimI-like enzyme
VPTGAIYSITFFNTTKLMIELQTYTPDNKQAFIDLNTEWLQEYFYVEEHDREVFNNIESLIIQPGGQIFFVLVNKEVVGTVAMQPIGNKSFELCKMAVTKSFQGQGLSKKLMDACIAFAIDKKATTIILFSNRKLEAAINLYKQYGFKEIPLATTDYSRADIQMELLLGTNVL